MSSIKKTMGLVVFTLIIGLAFIWFGVFNIAANNKHWNVTTSLLEIVRDRSISVRAEEILVPDLDNIERVKRGVANYAAMCTQCHLAPGVDTSELYEGLYPKPPVLYKNKEFASQPNQTFWVIKNGLKMTGMPAWGIYNSDEQIWDLIATVKAMGSMTPAQYKKLEKSGKHTHKGGGHDSIEMQLNKTEPTMSKRKHDNLDGHHDKKIIKKSKDNHSAHTH